MKTVARSEAEVRLDKWLWAVRLFKTRGLAAEACAVGHVTVNGQRAKPGRTVHPGELVEAQVGEVRRTVRVLGTLERRVGAQAVAPYIQDLTPPEELNKPREARVEPLFHRPKGAGRPTKRDRRLLERMGWEDPA
jgi:ribosome-associated heat shock protein Hsp15